MNSIFRLALFLNAAFLYPLLSHPLFHFLIPESMILNLHLHICNFDSLVRVAPAMYAGHGYCATIKEATFLNVIMLSCDSGCMLSCNSGCMLSCNSGCITS
jgi:hypothetical protein